MLADSMTCSQRSSSLSRFGHGRPLRDSYGFIRRVRVALKSDIDQRQSHGDCRNLPAANEFSQHLGGSRLTVIRRVKC